MYPLILSFFLGSLLPAIAIYLTGGSNRFMFTFGLILGLTVPLLPIILYPKKISGWLWSASVVCDQLISTIKSKPSREPVATPHSQVLEDYHIKPEKEQKVPDVDKVSPYAWDCTSALVNLGLSLNKSKRVVAGLVADKEYGSLEELLGDAVKVTTGKAR